MIANITHDLIDSIYPTRPEMLARLATRRTFAALTDAINAMITTDVESAHEAAERATNAANVAREHLRTAEAQTYNRALLANAADDQAHALTVSLTKETRAHVANAIDFADKARKFYYASLARAKAEQSASS